MSQNYTRKNYTRKNYTRCNYFLMNYLFLSLSLNAFVVVYIIYITHTRAGPRPESSPCSVEGGGGCNYFLMNYLFA